VSSLLGAINFISTALNMRTDGMLLHKMPLFCWAIFVTAILLLITLPVLAGDILPAINLAVCWEPSLFSLNLLVLEPLIQSAGNLFDLIQLGILRDPTPEFIFCNIVVISSASLDVRGKAHHLFKWAGRCYAPAIGRTNKRFKSLLSIQTGVIAMQPEPNLNRLDFSSYLAGLIEGDGSIFVPKTLRSTKGKLNYPSIQLCFHLKDLPLAMLIQKELGYGSLARVKGINAYVLTINQFKGLILVTSLINGNMKTPKVQALFKLIDWLNYRFDNLYINKLPLNTHQSLSGNAWLSGFIEADAHFSLRTSLSGKYPRVECKLEISQRQKDQKGYDNLSFLTSIADFLLTSVKPIRLDRVKPEYRIRTTSLRGNLVLENYLNNYPLFGTKYLDSIDWLKALNIFKEGLHKDNNKISNEILEIKSVMNDRRQQFVWDHLQNFYKLDK
jgi:LAGLIDADG endonuclease/Cytochrome C and Quinol oxidase polypeptide I